MNTYELTLVLKEAGAQDEKKIKALVPGKLSNTKFWGLIDFAYPIKGEKRGAYWWMTVELEAAKISQLEKTLKQNEAVLRHLLISA